MMPDLQAIRDLVRGFAKAGLWPDEICRSVSRYLARKRAVKLPLRVRFYLAVCGFCPIITLKTDGWGPLAFYLVKCPRHGIVISYPHGYEGYFICPLCVR